MTARPTDPRSTRPVVRFGALPPAVACLSLLALLFIPGETAAAVFVLLVGVAPACFLMLALGQRRGGRVLRWTVGVAALTVGGGFAVLLKLAGSDPLRYWMLGLPLPTGIQIWLIGLLPVLVLGWLFARSSATAPSAEEVRQLRDLGRRGAESDG